MNIDKKILNQYLKSKGSDASRADIFHWFNSIEHEKSLREYSREEWDEMQENTETPGYDENIVLGRIYREIKRKEAGQKPKTFAPIRILNALARIAAVLFIPLLVLYLGNDRQKISKEEISYTEIYSPLGARTQFYLPDGSKGWLSGGSTLKYPERFPGKTRNVSLKGEAYFDIETNPKKPFVVTGKHLNIVARGTSFNVRDWDDVPETEVVLVEGRVDVYNQNQSGQKLVSSLTPGQLLHCVPEATGSYVQTVDVEKYIAWTEGKLVFRDDPFGEVVKRINRWYNVNIVIKDKVLESYKYVATFEDETLDEILKMLTISAPIRYRELKRLQHEDGSFEKRTIELYYRPVNKK